MEEREANVVKLPRKTNSKDERWSKREHLLGGLGWSAKGMKRNFGSVQYEMGYTFTLEGYKLHQR